MSTVLVTGGAGFIGSHTSVELLNAGYDIIILDNFVNSKPESLKRIKELTGKDFKFYQADIRDEEAMTKVFAENKIDAVIHFAGLKSVPQSVKEPLNYYDNNIAGTVCLCRVMDKAGCKKLVFSSSATVYGSKNPSPLREDMPTGGTTNPYGTTKYFIEQILQDLCISDSEWGVSILRYFNPIGAHKSELKKLYEGELMLGGGHVAGWAVEDPALIAQIENALTVLGSQEEFDKKYPDATRRDPLTLAVGDGNHSLATAKACWEELKKTLTPEQAENHPARWCLAEVCNVHSPAIEIEPIHRVLFNVDCATVLLSLITWSDSNMAGCCFGGSKKQPFTLAGPHMANVLSFEDPTEPLTVGTIDDFISDYIERHPEAKVDYVHDEPAVRALCKQGAVAFLMPPFAKSDLFRGVVMGGVLPRKTFSMGHAEEKRYYIECRKITE